MPDTASIQAFVEPAHVARAAQLDSFVAEQIATLPHAADDAGARAQAPDIVRALGQGGVLSHLAPFELRMACLVREALAWASPLADDLFAIQGLATLPIALSEAGGVAAEWAKRALSGEAVGAFAMTEPRAGSDVGAMATRAVSVDGGYVLNGHKTLISNAGIADYYVVFASTDPEQGRRGLSCFVVEADNPGLRFDRPLLLSSPHPLGAVSFHDCFVKEEARLGAEGKGFKLGMATLDRMRPTVAAAACGMARRALDESLDYAAQRKQFGSPIADYQLIQQKLARTATDLTASRLLVYQAAWEHDRGAERITLQSAMSKWFATEAAQRAVDDAVQIHGGVGALADHPVDVLYRAVRSLRIYEGTSEIQQVVIARALLSDAAQRER